MQGVVVGWVAVLPVDHPQADHLQAGLVDHPQAELVDHPQAGLQVSTVQVQAA